MLSIVRYWVKTQRGLQGVCGGLTIDELLNTAHSLLKTSLLLLLLVYNPHGLFSNLIGFLPILSLLSFRYSSLSLQGRCMNDFCLFLFTFRELRCYSF